MCKAETALQKSITGWEYEETITTGKRSIDENGGVFFIPSGIKKIKKYRPPSDSAIQFALKKLKPELYGDKNIISTAINNAYTDWSLEEIETEIKKLTSDIETKALAKSTSSFVPLLLIALIILLLCSFVNLSIMNKIFNSRCHYFLY